MKTKIWYLHKPGDWRDVYEVGQTAIVSYPKRNKILAVKFNPKLDQTSVKLERQ